MPKALNEVLMIGLNALAIYLAIIVFTRIAGLRSFSKMSSFDFAMTVAIGSVVATTVLSESVTILDGVVGLAALYLLQIAVAQLRKRSRRASALVDNEPILLMRGREMLEDRMRSAGVTRDDLRAKLREANVLQFHQVRAVVMETTGDISVLHSADPEMDLDPALLERVRGVRDGG